MFGMYCRCQRSVCISTRHDIVVDPGVVLQNVACVRERFNLTAVKRLHTDRVIVSGISTEVLWLPPQVREVEAERSHR